MFFDPSFPCYAIMSIMDIPPYSTKKLVSHLYLMKLIILCYKISLKSAQKRTLRGLLQQIQQIKRSECLYSWPSFQQEPTIENNQKSKVSYLTTIPKSSEYPVCKTYLDVLVDTMEILEVLFSRLPVSINYFKKPGTSTEMR